MAAGKWDATADLFGGMVGSLLTGDKLVNPFRPDGPPREPTPAEAEHDSGKAWKLVDRYFDQFAG